MERLKLKKNNNLILGRLVLITSVLFVISIIFGVIYTSNDITLSEDVIEIQDTLTSDTIYLKYQKEISNLQMQLYDKELESIRRSADINRLLEVVNLLSMPNPPKDKIKEFREHYKKENYKH